MNHRHLVAVPDPHAGIDEPTQARGTPSAAARLDRPVIVHVAGRTDDVPRLAPVTRALEDTGSFAQVVLDAGADGPTAGALADFAVPAQVRRVAVPAGSDGQRVAALLDAMDRELCSAAPAALAVHAAGETALAAALAAARHRLPLIRVGRAASAAPRSAQVIERLADLLFVPDRGSFGALVHRGIGPERIAVVGEPLADAVRNAAGAAAARDPRVVRRLRARRYVLAVFSGGFAPPESARALLALAEHLPLVVELSAAIAADWQAAGVLPPLEAAWAASAGRGGFAERVSLTRSAGAVITDSETVGEVAALLGVKCHLTAAEDPWAIATVRPPAHPHVRRAVPACDGRAGARVAAAMVANFALIRTGR
jgi:hypothetical protein